MPQNRFGALKMTESERRSRARWLREKATQRTMAAKAARQAALKCAFCGGDLEFDDIPPPTVYECADCHRFTGDDGKPMLTHAEQAKLDALPEAAGDAAAMAGMVPAEDDHDDSKPIASCPNCGKKFRLTESNSLPLQTPCCLTPLSTRDVHWSAKAARRLADDIRRAARRLGEHPICHDGDPVG
jgi:hypothetical protein